MVTNKYQVEIQYRSKNDNVIFTVCTSFPSWPLEGTELVILMVRLKQRGLSSCSLLKLQESNLYESKVTAFLCYINLFHLLVTFSSLTFVIIIII